MGKDALWIHQTLQSSLPWSWWALRDISEGGLVMATKQSCHAKSMAGFTKDRYGQNRDAKHRHIMILTKLSHCCPSVVGSTVTHRYPGQFLPAEPESSTWTGPGMSLCGQCEWQWHCPGELPSTARKQRWRSSSGLIQFWKNGQQELGKATNGK